MGNVTNYFDKFPYNYFISLCMEYRRYWSFSWNYSTTKAPVNIVICTIVNLSMQFLAVYLFSKEMLAVIQPYMIGIAVLTLIGHLIAFYFYKRILNKKIADELNELNIQ